VILFIACKAILKSCIEFSGYAENAATLWSPDFSSLHSSVIACSNFSYNMFLERN